MASIRVFSNVLSKRNIFICSMPNTCLWYSFNNSLSIRQKALYSSKKSIAKTEHIQGDNKIQLSVGEVVKENTKSSLYLSVILVGLGITGYVLYVIFNELLSSNTPNGVYSKALKQCLADTRVVDALGEPIKAYGEENRRRRRQHVSHSYYLSEGVKHMRMKFHIQGSRRHASVLLEVKENKSGDYEYTYLYVLVDDIVKTVIQLEDNRSKTETYSFDSTEVKY